MTTQITNPVTNQTPYLRATRSFPLESQNLSLEMNKSYLDVANAVNNRTIGIYPKNTSAIGGESWFITSQKQQNLRQVYTFTAAGNIPHGLNFEFIERFTKCQGAYTDGTNWYGVIFGSSVAIPGQVSFYITPFTVPGTGNIVVLLGAGAPAITSGTIVLEWLSQV